VEGFTNYGVLPRGTKMIFNDKNEQEELERQQIRTGAAEEAAIIANAKIFPPEVIAMSLIRRGIYDQKDFDNTPPEWWKKVMETNSGENKNQPVGDRGGNTVGEDARRVDNEKTNVRGSDRLRKEESEVTEEKQDKSLLVKLLESVMVKKEKPPTINVTVNTQPSKAPNVTVEAPEYKQPNVTVNVPRQAPPNIIVKQPDMVPPAVNVTNQVHPAKVDVAAPVVNNAVTVQPAETKVVIEKSPKKKVEVTPTSNGGYTMKET